MSLILWIWNLFPAWLVSWSINLMILLGIVGIYSAWFGKWIPIFNVYAPSLKLIGIVLLVVGVFFKGGESVEKVWRDRVADLEEKVRIAEQAAADANGKIETVYVDRIQIVRDTKVVIQNDIKKNANKIDMVCTVEPEAISILNEAAKLPKKGDKK